MNQKLGHKDPGLSLDIARYEKQERTKENLY